MIAPFDGAQSLKVTSPGPFKFRMVGVAVPVSTFLVRLFIKSDRDIGQDGHNAFFQAMTDPNYHHSVAVATDGEQALAQALELRPDLLLLDVMMPKKSGLDVCRELQKRGFAAPIVILSARDQEVDVVLGLDLAKGRTVGWRQATLSRYLQRNCI